MDNDVEQLIKTCTRCQTISKPIKQTPVMMTNLPIEPWETIAADFYGDLPTGEKLLVITDLYSKFPIIEVLRSTKLQTVGERFDDLFSLFGFSKKILTDNGPPWDSYDFKRFLEQRNIKHELSIPLSPRSNGRVERFMPSITKTVQHSNDWKQPLHYRNTVHPATNEKPAKLFLNRETNNGIPSTQLITAPDFTSVKKYHESYITKAKLNADKRSANYKRSLQPGDKVLMKRGKKIKFQSTYFDDIFEVKKIQGSMITVQKDNKQSYKRY
jgi:Integrase core domain.